MSLNLATAFLGIVRPTEVDPAAWSLMRVDKHHAPGPRPTGISGCHSGHWPFTLGSDGAACGARVWPVVALWRSRRGVDVDLGSPVCRALRTRLRVGLCLSAMGSLQPQDERAWAWEAVCPMFSSLLPKAVLTGDAQSRNGLRRSHSQGSDGHTF